LARPFLFNAVATTVAFPDSVADPDLLPFLLTVALMTAFDERVALPFIFNAVVVVTALPIKLADTNTLFTGGNDVICAFPDNVAMPCLLDALAVIVALADNVALPLSPLAVLVVTALPIKLADANTVFAGGVAVT